MHRIAPLRLLPACVDHVFLPRSCEARIRVVGAAPVRNCSLGGATKEATRSPLLAGTIPANGSWLAGRWAQEDYFGKEDSRTFGSGGSARNDGLESGSTGSSPN